MLLSLVSSYFSSIFVLSSSLFHSLAHSMVRRLAALEIKVNYAKNNCKNKKTIRTNLRGGNTLSGVLYCDLSDVKRKWAESCITRCMSFKDWSILKDIKNSLNYNDVKTI